MYNIMQCKSYDETKIVYPVFAQVKMDGIFGRWDSETQKFYTRSGNVIKGLSTLEGECTDFPDLDGELVIPGVPFFEANGLIRSDKKTPTCMFYVFDMPNKQRYFIDRYRTYFEQTSYVAPHVYPVKAHLCHNKYEADQIYEKILKARYEGVVYKSCNMTYYKGKKWFVQKRVPEFTVECKVIGFEEGKKGFIGKLGAFIVNHNGISLRVGGGKGVTHDFRQQVWDRRNEYLGALIKVSYKSVTPSGSLRSPKYIGIRWDI